jgi:hypothetical protein
MIVFRQPEPDRYPCKTLATAAGAVNLHFSQSFYCMNYMKSNSIIGLKTESRRRETGGGRTTASGFTFESATGSHHAFMCVKFYP